MKRDPHAWARFCQPLGLLLLYALLVSIGSIFLPRLPWYLPNQEAAAWQTWAVIVGGAVVVWYAWETREMRRETLRQTEIGPVFPSIATALRRR